MKTVFRGTVCQGLGVFAAARVPPDHENAIPE